MAPQSEIAIEHVGGSAPAAFRVTRRADGKSLAAVTLTSPYEFEVEGRAGSSLMKELRWYLEHFLDYPYPPETDRAEDVLAALKAWGSQCFNAIFDRRDADRWLAESNVLQIKSDDPVVLSWPWEALFDPQAGSYLVHHRRMERQLNKLTDPAELGDLPEDRVNILLVVARPYRNDVGYRSIARPLVDLVRSKGLPAHVEVLRPPTFDQLRAHLESRPGYYHVLHFDGHGAYDTSGGAGSPFQGPPSQFKTPQGCLLFENADCKEDARSAEDLSTLLKRHAVPAVVMNACQAGMLNAAAEDAFACVATSLLRSGMRSVVAMAYSLYVSGAQAFLPAFYEGLFRSGSVAEGVRAGREEMFSKKRRTSPRGPYELHDWLLPVLYQQEPQHDFSFAAKATVEARQSRLPAEVLKYREEEFVGRDGPILAMERAMQLKTPCILVQGMGGVGKTTLVRGFLFWLDDTGGLDAALWFDFRDIRSAEFVLNRTGELFYGENFALAKNKPELLAEAFKKHRVVMVWDNFESAAANLTSADRKELGSFLQAIRNTKGKVIVTSRDSEEWMETGWRSCIELPGLDGDERWEFCEAVVSGLGLGKVDREDPEIVELMKLLGGHPLAMRVVLSKLEKMPAAKVLGALRNNIAELGLNPERESESRVFATLRFVEQGLAEELRPMLGLVGLHESYLDADYMEDMAKQVDPAWTRPLIDRLMTALTAAGLLRDIGQATYEMHPLLTSYLRSTVAASQVCQRAFADIMGRVAHQLAPKEEHEQRAPFLLHGANFQAALRLAEVYAMEVFVEALTQSIAQFALNSRNFVQAALLFRKIAERRVLREDWKGAASNYHQLGRVAEEQRDFQAAREWYLKSLHIKEKHGNLHGAALSYHQLGIVAQEERDFKAAQEWYLRSLAILEKQGDLNRAASSYHQLGRLEEEEGDFKAAREWYLKSLAIAEKQGDLHGAAITYHQLGRVAREDRDFEASREWYLKALAIFDKQGNLHEAASSYHQLGIVAQEERDFEAAREWYLQSLAIEEKQDNLHGAAITYCQLGILSEQQGDRVTSAAWLVRAIKAFIQTSNPHLAQRAVSHLVISHQDASPEDRQRIEDIWQDEGLGPFPRPETEP